MTKKRRKNAQKAKKKKKKRKNDTFLRKKAHKFAHPIQMPPPMLKWVRFCGVKFVSQNEGD